MTDWSHVAPHHGKKTLMEFTHVVDDGWVKGMIDKEEKTPHKYVWALGLTFAFDNLYRLILNLLHKRLRR